MKSTIESYLKEFQGEVEVHLRKCNLDDIVTIKELRAACEQNFCGQFNKNWMCPPAVGNIEDLISNLNKYTRGVLIQTVHKIEDSFDIDGMREAKVNHDKVISRIQKGLNNDAKNGNLLFLSAGECSICLDCTYKINEQCLFPEEAIASVESYGIDVNSTLLNCGLKYNNGANTVSYVGLVLSSR